MESWVLLFDRFEVLAEASNRTCFDEEFELRGSELEFEPARWGPLFTWKLTPWSGSKGEVFDLYSTLGIGNLQLPPFFEALLLSYRWFELELNEDLTMLPNDGGPGLSRFAKRVTRDRHIFAELRKNGLLQIGRPAGGNYDPIAIDLNPETHGRVVRIDHEEVLSRNRLGSITEIAGSFDELILESARPWLRRGPTLRSRVDEALHYLWDPIGIRTEPSTRDEYHCYLDEILTVLNSGADPTTLAYHLASIRTQSMGQKAEEGRSKDFEVDHYLAAVRKQFRLSSD